MKSKIEVRSEMRALRRAISDDVRRMSSINVCNAILARSDIREAVKEKRTFAIYLASKDEIDLTTLWETLEKHDVPVAVPYWNDAEKTYELSICRTNSKFEQDPHHILQPIDIQCISPAEIAVWIVPGLAFTADGKRLGYGGGWYDRFLSGAAAGAITIGVGYSFQLLDDLPCDAFDQRVGSFIAPTES